MKKIMMLAAGGLLVAAGEPGTTASDGGMAQGHVERVDVDGGGRTGSTADPLPGAIPAAEIIDKLAEAFEQRYVFPESGLSYARALRRNLAAGAYATIRDRAQFAARVTQDLQAVFADQHVRLVAAAPGEQNQRRAMGLTGSGIAEANWLADGVGYIAFTMFSGSPDARQELARRIEQFSPARTLILDLRENRGGGRAEMDLLLSHLFDSEVELLHTDRRVLPDFPDDGPPDASGVVRPVGAPDGFRREAYFAVPAEGGARLAETDVIILTSRRTASAAEHFTLALKRTGRATIVGEPTRGAGHFGMPVSVGHGFFAFIPFGRTFDPATGEGWEGSGVEPDVVTTAEGALPEALRRATIAREQQGERRTASAAL